MNPIFSALIASLLIATSAVGAGAQSTMARATDAEMAKLHKGVEAWDQGKHERALKIWRQLADKGNAEAQYKLGQAYKLGQGAATDLPLALDWFRKAGAQGHVEANDNVGQLLVELGHHHEALPFIRASAERGEPHALYLYATNLFNGDIVERDWVKAYAMMTRAARAGVTQAQPSLVQMDRYISEHQRQEGLSLAALAIGGGDAGAGLQASAPVAGAAGTAGTAPVEPVVIAATPAGKSVINLTEIEPSRTPTNPVPPAPIAETRAAAMPVATPAPEPMRRPAPAPVAKALVSAAKAAATTAPLPSGRWRVQLGAFREEGRAQDLWRTIRPKVSGLAALKPTFLPTQGLTRLLVGPIASADEARALCVRIRAAGAPCIALAL